MTTPKRRGGTDKTTRRNDSDITIDVKRNGLEDAGGEDDESDDIRMPMNTSACYSTTPAKGHWRSNSNDRIV